MCLVLKLTDGRFSGIFGGDISSEVEKKLVNEYGDGPVSYTHLCV